MTISGAPGGATPAVAPTGADRTDPVRLLRSWVPGRSSWFSGPAGSLLAHGRAAVLDDPDPDAVLRRLGEVAGRGAGAPLVAGALPFDAGAPAHLVVPETVAWAPPLGAVLTAERSGPPTVGALRPTPTPDGYRGMVDRALGHLRGGALDKVVLARTLDLAAEGPVDAAPMLRELARRDPRAYLFAVSLPAAGRGPRTFLGATPELLLSRRGPVVTANPLAGSAARGTDPAGDPEDDRRRGQALLDSAKDRHEHALVVGEVIAGLRPFCRELEVPDEPSLVRTATLWHLSTRIRARVADPADPALGALHLARALHPTPAVCGVPRDRARTAIAEIEPFERGFYTGMVGWTDVHGDGEWVVALRCGDVEDRGVRLFAGAGIVPASRPEAELDETTVKLRTLLAALGLDEA